MPDLFASRHAAVEAGQSPHATADSADSLDTSAELHDMCMSRLECFFVVGRPVGLGVDNFCLIPYMLLFFLDPAPSRAHPSGSSGRQDPTADAAIINVTGQRQRAAAGRDWTNAQEQVRSHEDP